AQLEAQLETRKNISDEQARRTQALIEERAAERDFNEETERLERELERLRTQEIPAIERRIKFAIGARPAQNITFTADFILPEAPVLGAHVPLPRDMPLDKILEASGMSTEETRDFLAKYNVSPDSGKMLVDELAEWQARELSQLQLDLEKASNELRVLFELRIIFGISGFNAIPGFVPDWDADETSPMQEDMRRGGIDRAYVRFLNTLEQNSQNMLQEARALLTQLGMLRAAKYALEIKLAQVRERYLENLIPLRDYQAAIQETEALGVQIDETTRALRGLTTVLVRMRGSVTSAAGSEEVRDQLRRLREFMARRPLDEPSEVSSKGVLQDLNSALDRHPAIVEARNRAEEASVELHKKIAETEIAEGEELSERMAKLPGVMQTLLDREEVLYEAKKEALDGRNPYHPYFSSDLSPAVLQIKVRERIIEEDLKLDAAQQAQLMDLMMRSLGPISPEEDGEALDFEEALEKALDAFIESLAKLGLREDRTEYVQDQMREYLEEMPEFRVAAKAAYVKAEGEYLARKLASLKVKGKNILLQDVQKQILRGGVRIRYENLESTNFEDALSDFWRPSFWSQGEDNEIIVWDRENGQWVLKWEKLPTEPLVSGADEWRARDEEAGAEGDEFINYTELRVRDYLKDQGVGSEDIETLIDFIRNSMWLRSILLPKYVEEVDRHLHDIRLAKQSLSEEMAGELERVTNPQYPVGGRVRPSVGGQVWHDYWQESGALFGGLLRGGVRMQISNRGDALLRLAQYLLTQTELEATQNAVRFEALQVFLELTGADGELRAQQDIYDAGKERLRLRQNLLSQDIADNFDTWVSVHPDRSLEGKRQALQAELKKIISGHPFISLRELSGRLSQFQAFLVKEALPEAFRTEALEFLRQEISVRQSRLLAELAAVVADQSQNAARVELARQRLVSMERRYKVALGYGPDTAIKIDYAPLRAFSAKDAAALRAEIESLSATLTPDVQLNRERVRLGIYEVLLRTAQDHFRLETGLAVDTANIAGDFDLRDLAETLDLVPDEQKERRLGEARAGLKKGINGLRRSVLDIKARVTGTRIAREAAEKRLEAAHEAIVRAEEDLKKSGTFTRSVIEEQDAKTRIAQLRAREAAMRAQWIQRVLEASAAATEHPDDVITSGAVVLNPDYIKSNGEAAEGESETLEGEDILSPRFSAYDVEILIQAFTKWVAARGITPPPAEFERAQETLRRQLFALTAKWHLPRAQALEKVKAIFSGKVLEEGLGRPMDAALTDALGTVIEAQFLGGWIEVTPELMERLTAAAEAPDALITAEMMERMAENAESHHWSRTLEVEFFANGGWHWDSFNKLLEKNHLLSSKSSESPISPSPYEYASLYGRHRDTTYTMLGTRETQQVKHVTDPAPRGPEKSHRRLFEANMGIRHRYTVTGSVLNKTLEKQAGIAARSASGPEYQLALFAKRAVLRDAWLRWSMANAYVEEIKAELDSLTRDLDRVRLEDRADWKQSPHNIEDKTREWVIAKELREEAGEFLARQIERQRSEIVITEIVPAPAAQGMPSPEQIAQAAQLAEKNDPVFALYELSIQAADEKELGAWLDNWFGKLIVTTDAAYLYDAVAEYRWTLFDNGKARSQQEIARLLSERLQLERDEAKLAKLHEVAALFANYASALELLRDALIQAKIASRNEYEDSMNYRAAKVGIAQWRESSAKNLDARQEVLRASGLLRQAKDALKLKLQFWGMPENKISEMFSMPASPPAPAAGAEAIAVERPSPFEERLEAVRRRLENNRAASGTNDQAVTEGNTALVSNRARADAMARERELARTAEQQAEKNARQLEILQAEVLKLLELFSSQVAPPESHVVYGRLVLEETERKIEASKTGSNEAVRKSLAELRDHLNRRLAEEPSPVMEVGAPSKRLRDVLAQAEVGPPASLSLPARVDVAEVQKKLGGLKAPETDKEIRHLDSITPATQASPATADVALLESEIKELFQVFFSFTPEDEDAYHLKDWVEIFVRMASSTDMPW
ncbi:MAG: hypothetical protein HY586_05790, partial [Candidatus Omnitrophica bacterium]|nr:hypothetical protein [Candidatus Omnitrophota bacterium]